MTSEARWPAASGRARGVDTAFEELYAAAYDRLVQLARLTSAETVPAEEIVQDAFVQLYRRWSTVEQPEASALGGMAGVLRATSVPSCR